MPGVDDLKRAAAARALAEVESGMVLGLGTGSTVAHFLELLARALGNGELERISGVPTSERTAEAAEGLGIPLTTLEAHPELDLTVDGADEVDPELDLIKGLGGALFREKLVAQASGRLVIVADGGKRVERLGDRSPVPVEVVPFGWSLHVPFLADLGARPVLRVHDDGVPYTTDNGNLIVDAHFDRHIPDPAALERALRARTGVVESGLFLGMAHGVALADEDGVRFLTREGGGAGP
jgi:ribose 5-phosphate isomerase A